MGFSQVRIVIFFALLLTAGLHSQTKENVVPLKQVILKIEEQYQVKFSYSDEVIHNKNIENFSAELPLDELLKNLAKQTNLLFKQTTNRYILILEKNINSDKTICGYVIDKYSKEPIEGASVYVKTKSIGTITNYDGYFELKEVSKEDELLITYSGYKTIAEIVSLVTASCNTYEIEEYSSKLDEVLINSYLVNGITKNKDGSIAIKPQQREILPGLTEPDVLQSIQLLPGVLSPNETSSGLHIRGGTPDQNLVLFDGIRVYNPAHFFGMISAFNPYIIDEVNVLSEGVGAQYGNHVSGVIDIRTKSKVANKTKASLGTNLTHADAFLEMPLWDKASILISGRRSLSDIFETSTFQSLAKKVFQNTIIDQNEKNDVDQVFDKNNKFYFLDFNTKLIFDIGEKDQLMMHQLFVSNKLDYRFGLSDGTFLQNDKLDVENLGLGANWTRKWNNNVTQETSLYFSDYELDYNFIGEQNVDPVFSQSSIKKNSIKEFNFKTGVNTNLNQYNQLGFGFELINNDVSYNLGRTYSFSPESDYNIEEASSSTIYALYGNYKFDKEDKVNINVGLRNTYFSLENTFFVEPRLYAQVKLFPSLWVNFSYEKKQQNISQLIEFSTNDFGLENYVWSLSNKNEIPILNSDQVSTGFVFKKDSWMLDVNTFYKTIDGLTSLAKGVATNANITANGSSVSKGINVLLKKQFTNYTSWVSYSFGDTTFEFPETNDGKPFSGSNDITHRFRWSNSYEVGNFDFSLGWVYRTGIPFTEVIETNNNGTQEFSFGDVNGRRLDSYQRLDFSSTYKFNISRDKKWKAKLGVSFLNIIDRSNTLQRNFFLTRDQDSNIILGTTDTVSLGFTPNVMFRIIYN
ncbi:carboxypeptidase-like regulatory domain-containing protein [Tenacibaculum sp. MEBiC06402]|uniref:carboxypeptidase-like regulatory domain-containing protein n=1 Tax=unclassified Tenacibaculum TaxID=2635139 RepID=UPI003B99A778